MTMLTYEIQKVDLKHRYTAVVRAELPGDELAGWMLGAFGAVKDYLERVGVAPSGLPFARLAFLGETVAAEAGFPVPGEIEGDGLVQPSTLPDGPAAVVTHVGPYDGLAETQLAVRHWLDEHRFVPIGPHWEVYYLDPAALPEPACWRVDLVQPFRPA
ncbi:MAG TPA: GyrI-like domain-containing protein [Pilimelia sp.]|nr:GyrI-like domain-containing protein [Pilimelia sp.]